MGKGQCRRPQGARGPSELPGQASHTLDTATVHVPSGADLDGVGWALQVALAESRCLRPHHWPRSHLQPVRCRGGERPRLSLSPLKCQKLLPGSFLWRRHRRPVLKRKDTRSPSAVSEQPGSRLGLTPGFLRDPDQSRPLSEPQFPHLSRECTGNVIVRINSGNEDRL